jgi:crotonobetaine/carnitine-CoA ligase
VPPPAPGQTDPRIPPADRCVVRAIVERRAVEHPDRRFATFASGAPPWTYGELRQRAIDAAAGFAACGVRQGDHVAVWLPNSDTLLGLVMGLAYLGAVYVPLNLAYRGGILQHTLALSDAALLVAHRDLVVRLADVETGPVRRLVVLGGDATAPAGIETIPPATLLAAHADAPPALDRPVQPWDSQAIIYTSGTTGPSKGVLCSYWHLHSMAIGAIRSTPEDCGLVYTPMFHVTGLTPVLRALAAGCAVGIIEKYHTETFWRDVRTTGATQAVLIGSLLSFLAALPRGDDEINTTLRHVVTRLKPDSLAFVRRVGLTWQALFNMTEVSTPMCTEVNPTKLEICGRPRPGIEARVVDENDCEVPSGELGELILRSAAPWEMNSGYHKDPAATARAWRNGWFHTGDAFREDADGDFTFVDRLKDAIRRRGENISSYEVEIEVNAHPAVKDSAAIAVASPHGEDEVMCVIEPIAGRTIDPADLIAFLLPRLPHYMVPRYLRIVADLPRTPTLKVQKHLLRTAGITADTWDREAAGISVRRTRIG